MRDENTERKRIASTGRRRKDGERCPCASMPLGRAKARGRTVKGHLPMCSFYKGPPAVNPRFTPIKHSNRIHAGISITCDFDRDLKDWHPQQIQAFMQGVAQLVAAKPESA